MARALLDVGRMCRRHGIDPADPGADTDENVSMVFETAEGHRMMEAVKINARLELHDPRGRVTPWEVLLISDMDDIRAAARELERRDGRKNSGIDQLAAVDDEETGDPIRYFISAKLRGASRSTAVGS